MPNHQKESRNGVLKQFEKIKNIDFVCATYRDLKIPENSIIYCDPPYEGTTSYKDDFNHKDFWEWCREMKNNGHEIFISEYNAPDDFICLKVISTNTQLCNGSGNGSQIKTEKLFTL